MASSLRHFAHSPAGGSTAAAASTPSLLRRFSPDFCTFADLRPIRPVAATPKPARPAEQEQEQYAGAGTDEEPSVPTTYPPEPGATPAPALRVGIIGFGNFGQFIARGIQRQGHAVLASSRSDYSAYCSAHGIRFFR
ncbi:hypothetical protein QYE76_034045 [Lolium multiflorum]|uniref:Pyrroline-5-carboxylate reductase catalytic N-terminal domain-containing protein n=1 Tax=Lolium multiflorum TaxID=4521 RepID=A0AAD8QX94_LOLMU|nr:hypothetical protein QYE76_034045 [Lolium multiflorum]